MQGGTRLDARVAVGAHVEVQHAGGHRHGDADGEATGAAALLHCGRGFTVAKGPAPPVTRPTDILNCDYNRAPLYELDGQGRYITCGGLIAEVNCEFKAGFLAPAGMNLPSGDVCERGVRGTRDITYNRERLLSARFWQETG